MSNLDQARQIATLQAQLERLRKADTPELYLPWTQRVVNPFPLASSPGNWGDAGIPWAVNVLAFYCSVFVLTTNNGTNFWTLALIASPSSTTVASVTTSASSANTWTRLSDLTISQPATTDIGLTIQATATLSPGAIFIFPSVALLRAGN